MAFLVSPGVNVSEIDLTNVVVAAATSVGGVAGRFRWGPIEEVKLVTDEDNLVEMFQKPNDDNFEDFFTAANFLSYSNALNVVRAANTTVSNSASPKNAAAIPGGGSYADIQIKTSNHYYSDYDADTGGALSYTSGPVIAKWAGALGNTFKVSWCPSDRPSNSNMSGTVTWTNSGSAIVGTTTNFGDELRVGDIIDITGASGTGSRTGLVITSIVDDTNATAEALEGTVSDISVTAGFSRRKQSVYSQPSTEMAGTVTTAADSTTVNGAGTVFSAQFSVGDRITVGGETRKVASITSDTVLTVSEKFIGINAAAAYERSWEYAEAFPQGSPTTSAFAEDKGLALDEIHVAVIDEDGDWSGQKDSVVEAWNNLSVLKDAKSADGENVYYADFLNKYSEYVWWTDHPTFNVPNVTGADSTTTIDVGSASTITLSNGGTSTLAGWGITSSTALGLTLTGGFTFIMPQSGLSISLSGGTDGTAPSDADIIRAYDEMKSAEDVDVALISTSNHSSTVIRHCISNIAERRKDCVVFFSPEKTDVVGVTDSSTATDNVVAYRDTVNMNSSYGVMDSGYKYMFDKHNDKFRYVPLNGDIAGLCARTDSERDPFFSPGGFTRGQVKGVVKLPFNPKQAERDKLYASQINPVVTFPGEGTVLFGDKTQLTKPSAFDRINVRRLFILLEKAIANAARFQLFEFNDEFTRSQFVSIVEPFLRDIQGRGGITDFRVVCDSSNNTSQVVDSNQFRGDIFIKPTRAINFIQLNFVAVRSGVEFSEVAGAV